MLKAKSHNQNSKYQNWDFSCGAHCHINVNVHAAQLKIQVLIFAVLFVRFCS